MEQIRLCLSLCVPVLFLFAVREYRYQSVVTNENIMFLRFSLLLCCYPLFAVGADEDDILAQSCAHIIRPSQTYTPADVTLTIGTVPTYSYQECGQRCRVTTLCRTAVWCQGQCTLFQEYVAFGRRTPNLHCMLITLSGMAYNEVRSSIIGKFPEFERQRCACL